MSEDQRDIAALFNRACRGFGDVELSNDSTAADVWRAFAAYLLQQLTDGNAAEFEAGFRSVSGVIQSADSDVRQSAMPFLFGDFTRRAIAAGVDRTRFVEWLGPASILVAPAGRARGRVLYFNSAKGRGKLLASDGTVVFVHFSAIAERGFRTLAGGELVEFERVASPVGFEARHVIRLPD